MVHVPDVVGVHTPDRHIVSPQPPAHIRARARTGRVEARRMEGGISTRPDCFA
jgi:hypothetical protein